jgi:hypothetical protein
LVGVAHDWKQLQGAGANEKASADYLIGLIEQTGDSRFNTERFKQRARAAIMATEYEVDEETRVINQINLFKDEPYEDGKPDPLKFILAFADINAIAMKGPEEMYDNAIKLFFERNLEEPTEEALRGMLDYQQLFIRSQLNDYRMKPIIDRYFPDYKGLGEDGDNKVYTEMRKAYNPNIEAAHEDAKWLRGRSDIAKELEGMLHTFDFHAIAARLGKLIQLGRK